MKILLANKFYYPRGGDCVYTLNLEQLLRQNGHEVAVFAMQYPENLPTPWSKYFPSEVKFSLDPGVIEAILRPFGTKEVKQKFSELLDAFQPDVIHLNNVHSYLSPVVAKIAHKRGIRVVWTLHDYKLLCPRYDCLLNGKEACERCFTSKKYVLKNKCMKNSLTGSFIAYQEALKWYKEKLEKYTDTFICPSRFIANKMMSGGFDKNKMTVLNNFIDIEKTKKENYNKEDYYCYAGRLSQEKGIRTLIKTAKELPYHLKIIGGGPLLEEVQQSVKNANIEFLGYKKWDELKHIVGNARFSVLPSEWYENNPLSIIESLSLGTPVLGANTGGIPEMIEEGKNGMLFESRNVEDLKDKIQKMVAMQFDYKSIAEVSQEKYSGENHYKKLITIYKR
jgi:glycosyltransferase involved in cell wall biosynthesis